MFSIFSNKGKINYGITSYVLDTEEDLKNIPETVLPGSTCYIIDNSTKWIKNHKNEWKKMISSNIDSSGSDFLIADIDSALTAIITNQNSLIGG